MNKSHGGARQGAGKPVQFEKPMRRKEVMLDEETIKFYLEIGEGNLSKGIRQYWRSLTKHAPDARESGAKIVSSKSKRSVKPARG
jgi:hypothetical protein